MGRVLQVIYYTLVSDLLVQHQGFLANCLTPEWCTLDAVPL